MKYSGNMFLKIQGKVMNVFFRNSEADLQ